MKNRLLITAATLVGAALIPAVQAAPLTYTAGDIILGFELTGGSTSGNILELDLGQYSNLGSFSPVNLSSDLSGAFGPGWSNSVSYGAIGFYVNPVTSKWSNIYETTASATPLPTAYGYNTTTSLQNYQTLTVTGTSSYANLAAKTNDYSASGVGVITGSAQNGAWSTFNANGSAFGIPYSPGIEAAIGSSVGLYNVTAAGKFADTVADTPYDISVDTSGNLSVAAVPEPSTYVLFGLSALVLVITYRRKTSTFNS